MKSKIKLNTTDKLLFILEAQLFHGCTRKEALMLWNDGIDTLHTSAESICTTRPKGALNGSEEIQQWTQ